LTVAEGVDKVADEMRQSRILKVELANRPSMKTMAIQLFSAEYKELDTFQLVKAISFLSDPENAETFLALKDTKESQEVWLMASIE
jgi:hypothetical protein